MRANKILVVRTSAVIVEDGTFVYALGMDAALCPCFLRSPIVLS